MYEPLFNSVLVEISDEDAKWGTGNDDSMLGQSYSKGKVIAVGSAMETQDHPTPADLESFDKRLQLFKGRNIMWNEGTEAGTLFQFDGKLFGMIYWSDIRGVLVDAK